MIYYPIQTLVSAGIMDNVSFHKGERVRQSIEGVGARWWFIPAYSPDFSPIEFALAKLKALLRRSIARTLQALWEALAVALDNISCPTRSVSLFSVAFLLLTNSLSFLI